MDLVELAVGVVRLVEGEDGFTARLGEALAQVLIVCGLLGSVQVVRLLAVRLLLDLVVTWRLANRVHLIGRRVHYWRLTGVAELCGRREPIRQRAEVPSIQDRYKIIWRKRLRIP